MVDHLEGLQDDIIEIGFIIALAQDTDHGGLEPIIPDAVTVEPGLCCCPVAVWRNFYLNESLEFCHRPTTLRGPQKPTSAAEDQDQHASQAAGQEASPSADGHNYWSAFAHVSLLLAPNEELLN